MYNISFIVKMQVKGFNFRTIIPFTKIHRDIIGLSVSVLLLHTMYGISIYNAHIYCTHHTYTIATGDQRKSSMLFRLRNLLLFISLYDIRLEKPVVFQAIIGNIVLHKQCININARFRQATQVELRTANLQSHVVLCL